MLGTAASRITIAAASALIASGALALPAQADIPVAPHQFFSGQVFGRPGQNVIEVICPGLSTTGHPAPGQSVAVQPAVSTTSTSLGYTGNFGTEIDADLIYSLGPVTTVTAIAKFTSYGVKAEIPTTITTPCSGSGVMTFTPSPNPDVSGRPSNVSVTFISFTG